MHDQASPTIAEKRDRAVKTAAEIIPFVTVRLRVSPHLISLLEVFHRIGDDLPIRRMIDGFNADDFRQQCEFMGVHVFDELQLRRRWPNDQDIHRVFDGARDGKKVLPVVFGMRLRTFWSLGMLMMHWPVCFEGLFIDMVGIDVEDPRFAVIDPDGDVF